jgi:hypothetical protein
MSDKPVYQKLMIKPGSSVRLINAPPDAEQLLEGVPGDVTLEAIHSAPADTLLLFANNRAELEEHLPVWGGSSIGDTRLWVLYHKGTSRIKTDIHRDSINSYAKSLGLQGVFMVSIDADWSALRLKQMEAE